MEIADMKINSYEVRVRGFDHATTINAPSAGKAKYEHFLNVRDCFANLKITDLRAVKVGGPITSKDFMRNAEYRGVAVKCGDRVKVGKSIGTIVGHDAIANFLVWFDPDCKKYPGLKLSVHPDEMEILK